MSEQGTDQAIFTPRLLAAFIAAATLTVVLSLFFMLHGESTSTVGPSTFSRSAIGHAGIADILQRTGFTVIKSQGDSLHRVGAGGVLVLAEPQLDVPADRAQMALLQANKVLLVLPKWLGSSDSRQPGWIDMAAPISTLVAQSVLNAVGGHGEVVRPAGPVVWRRNDIGAAPHLTAPVQLMTSTELRPIVGSDGGMLLGERRDNGRDLWVLSDPDAISNHGLGEGNAAFAIALFHALFPEGGSGATIVFDETVHGFTSVPGNPAALLLHKPFAAIALQAAAALALLLWAGAARFGAPEEAPPPLKAGKRDLVRNVADLFQYAGYQRVLVRRYVQETIRDVAHRLHMPHGLTNAASVDLLQRVGAARGVAVDCSDLSARADALAVGTRGKKSAELSRLPREIWRWKQEIIDGFAGSAGGRGRDSRGSPQGRGGTG
jgi:hypothetical protein